MGTVLARKRKTGAAGYIAQIMVKPIPVPGHDN